MCYLVFWKLIGNRCNLSYFDLSGSNLCIPTLILPLSLLCCYLKLILWNIDVSICNDKTMFFVTHSLCRPKENHQSYIGGNIKLELFILTWNRKKWSSLKDDQGVSCQSPKHKPNTVGKINAFYMVMSLTIWSFLNAKMPWVTKILVNVVTRQLYTERGPWMNCLPLFWIICINLCIFVIQCITIILMEENPTKGNSIHHCHCKMREFYKNGIQLITVIISWENSTKWNSIHHCHYKVRIFCSFF